MTRSMLLLELSLIVAIAAAITILYPHLAPTVPTHWNTGLQPDGYSPRWALFLLGPGLMAALVLLAWLGPWLSPANFQVASFRSTYNFILLTLLCAVACFTAIILWCSTGHTLNAGQAIQGGIGVLFCVVGNVFGKVRRNFFLGIRTPWALASERVWNATHRLAARTMVAGGVCAVILTAAGVPKWPVYILLAAVLAPAAYSLFLYKQLQARNEL